MRVLRSIAAVVAGFVVASAVMMIIESINGRVLYPELGALAQGLTDREAIRALVAAAPVGSLLVVLAGWTLGSIAGGLVARLIARASRPVLVLGVLLTLAGIANNLTLPPPLWFWIPTLVLFVPAALLGARFVPASRTKTPAAAGPG